MRHADLDPGREARLRLAFYDAYDARERADFRDRIIDLIDLHARLRAEQLAELGYVPSTIGGCIAVVNVAVAIAEVLQGTDE